MSRLERLFKRTVFSFFRLFIHVGKVGTIPRSSVRRILVIRQHNQLGDMLCAVPLLRALRTTYPDAFIALLARPMNSEVLRGSSFLDEVIVYDKRTFIRSPIEVWRFARSLRKKRFDLVIAPATVSMSVTSDVIAFLCGSKRRIGPGSLMGKRNMTAYLYNVPVHLDWSRDETVHQTKRNLDIASILVLEGVSLELEIALSQEERNRGAEFLHKRIGKRDLIFGFHPGAAKVQNRWDALHFAEIANRCAEILGASIVITAGPDDEDALKEMTINVPNETVVLHNEPIRFVASVIHHCDLFLTNDTGMMHVAAAVGTPTLSLFGPTDPLQWAPIGERHRFILGHGNSIDSIEVEKVWKELRAMLAGRLRQPVADERKLDEVRAT